MENPMSESISLSLPDEALEGFRRSAAAAGKPLEQFLAERLVEAVPAISEKLPESLQSELRSLEHLDDLALAEAAQCRLPDDKQHEYSDLLSKQTDGPLTAEESHTLRAIGDEARCLTLRRARALMLLKWRGHELPEPEQLANVE